MASIAISAAPPPAQGAVSNAAPGVASGANGAQPSPFGALMAMFDAALAPETAQPAVTIPDPGTSDASAIDAGVGEGTVAVPDLSEGADAETDLEAAIPEMPTADVSLAVAMLVVTIPAAQAPAAATAAPPGAPALPPTPAALTANALPAPTEPQVTPEALKPAPASVEPADLQAASAVLEAMPEAATPATPEAPQTRGDARRAEALARDPGAPGLQGPAASSESGHSNGRSSGDHPQGGQFNDPRTQGVNEARTAAPVETAAAAPSLAAPEAPAPTTAIPSAPAPPPAVQAAQLAAALPVRGSPETVAHFAAQLIQKLEGQTTRFDLALNPQSLGRVDVRIEIDRKGLLRAHMAFDTAEAAQQIGGRQAELRAALESAGFDLAEGALSFDVASGGGQGGAFADRETGASRRFQTIADAADAAPAAMPSYFTRAAAGGVDIRI
jgi:flagellar hook-length control protein FliK